MNPLIFMAKKINKNKIYFILSITLNWEESHPLIDLNLFPHLGIPNMKSIFTSNITNTYILVCMYVCTYI